MLISLHKQATTVAAGLAGGAHAATIGTAVTPGGVDIPAAGTIGGAAAPQRRTLVNLAGIGAESDVIGYFIPLSGGACTFGVNCGTSADSGTGGGPMTMYVDFIGVDGGQSFLNTWFEDLDLIGANDPAGFLESVSRSGFSGKRASWPSSTILPMPAFPAMPVLSRSVRSTLVS